jgi:oligopeptide transport system substrate-binding protein
MKKLALVLGLLMAFGLAVVGCSAPKYSLSVCVGPEPDTIDPALNSAVDGATLISHAFEGLMALDKNSVPIPGQAASYTVSADGLTYTFKLRDGLKWSDGKALTASDFVYSWNRVINPATASDYEYLFSIIKGYDAKTLEISAPDAKTFVVNLISKAPYFLELCAFPTFMPVREDVVTANPDTWATDPASYISNGPYTLTKWDHKSQMTYTKNPNYWNVGKIGPSTINFLLMDDDNAILAAFQNGAILFADSMPNDEIDAWRNKPEFHLQGQVGTYYVSYNNQNTYLKNPLLREALTLAVDRDYIVTQIGKAGQVPAGAFVPIGMTDGDATKTFRDIGGTYYDPTKAANAANLQKAKDLLTEAGYPGGKGLPTFEYLYNTSTGHKLIGEALQQMWKQIGVNVTLKAQEWNTFLNTRKNGDYEIARDGWLGDYNDPITFLDMFITGSGNNNSQYKNPAYDAIIAQIKASSDKTERFRLMHQAEDLLFHDWVFCPIYYYVDIYLLSSKVQGFYASPLGLKYFMYATVTK